MLKKFYFGFLAANKSIQIAAFLHPPPFTFSFFQKRFLTESFYQAAAAAAAKAIKMWKMTKPIFMVIGFIIINAIFSEGAAAGVLTFSLLPSSV